MTIYFNGAKLNGKYHKIKINSTNKNINKIIRDFSLGSIFLILLISFFISICEKKNLPFEYLNTNKTWADVCIFYV